MFRFVVGLLLIRCTTCRTDNVAVLTGEGLVERFVSILWAGTMSCHHCLPRRTNCSTSSDSLSDSDVGSVRRARHFLDAARVSCGGEYDDDEVDIVRDIVLTVPIFFTLITFSAFTSQVRMLTFIGKNSHYSLVVRASVFRRRTFPVLRSTCSGWMITDVGKPSATDQPTRPTQPFIPSGSINE